MYTGFSVQKSQRSALVMQSEADHLSAYHAQFNWACLGHLLLSCSNILTYQLLGSQLWTALPLEKSRSPATVNKVSN